MSTDNINLIFEQNNESASEALIEDCAETQKLQLATAEFNKIISTLKKEIQGTNINVTEIDIKGRPTRGVFIKGRIKSEKFSTEPQSFSIEYHDNGKYVVDILGTENSSITFGYNSDNTLGISVKSIQNETTDTFYTYTKGQLTKKCVYCHFDKQRSYVKESKFDILGRIVEQRFSSYEDEYTDVYSYSTCEKNSPCDFKREGFLNGNKFIETGIMEENYKDIKNSIKTIIQNDGNIEIETFVNFVGFINTKTNNSKIIVKTDSFADALKYEQELLRLRVIHTNANNNLSEEVLLEYKKEIENILSADNTPTQIKDVAEFIANNLYKN